MTARVNLVLPFSCVFIQINQVGHIKSLCDLTALVWRAVEITHESSQLVTLGGLRVHLHQVSVTIGATITRKQREHNYWKTERTQLPVNRENTITRKQRENPTTIQGMLWKYLLVLHIMVYGMLKKKKNV